LLRLQTIAPVAVLPVVGHAQADETATQLGLSRRRVYLPIQPCRQGLGVATDLARGQSDAGKGKGRLPEPVERLVRQRLPKRFLSRPKCTLAALYRDIARACRSQGLPVPARNTVESRVAALELRGVARKRDGPDAVRPLQSAAGATPEAVAAYHDSVHGTLHQTAAAGWRKALPSPARRRWRSMRPPLWSTSCRSCAAP
jgi:putative transposase